MMRSQKRLVSGGQPEAGPRAATVAPGTGAGDEYGRSAPGQCGSLTLPSISMPKGGGAIRGIGEKLTVGRATGTVALSSPVFTSPGRSGFGPALSPAYNSGGSNGPFGLGCRLSVGSATRKTSPGLPLYEDARDSDVFILSRAEDLVPLLREPAGGAAGDAWAADAGPDPTGRFTVRRYRPRAEADFTRVERWTAKPLLAAGSATQLAGLHGDGRLCAVTFAPLAAGYFERDGEGGWLPFRPFRSTGGVDWADPNARTTDLDGDGLAGLLVTGQPCCTWYPWLAEDDARED